MRLVIAQNEGKTLRIKIWLTGCCGDWMYKVKIVDRSSGKPYVQFDACGDSEIIAFKEAQRITQEMISKNPDL
jgi:hypothetical protein